MQPHHTDCEEALRVKDHIRTALQTTGLYWEDLSKKPHSSVQLLHITSLVEHKLFLDFIKDVLLELDRSYHRDQWSGNHPCIYEQVLPLPRTIVKISSYSSSLSSSPLEPVTKLMIFTKKSVNDVDTLTRHAMAYYKEKNVTYSIIIHHRPQKFTL